MYGFTDECGYSFVVLEATDPRSRSYIDFVRGWELSLENNFAF